MGEKLNTIPNQFIHWKASKQFGCVWTDGPDVFNMSVRILAPNALERSKGQRKTIRKHYMDLKFIVRH
jgi:hypothetical protein